MVKLEVLPEQLSDAVGEGKRKQFMADLTTVPLRMLVDFTMCKRG